MSYRKAELAEIQLDRAIKLFLDDGDYVSAATLAGAADAIFGALLERHGLPNALDQLHESWQAGSLTAIESKEFRNILNHVRNQLKHAGDPAYDELEVGQVDAMMLIARAAGMHPRFADTPTPNLQRFREWWMAEAEKLINSFPDLED